MHFSYGHHAVTAAQQVHDFGSAFEFGFDSASTPRPGLGKACPYLAMAPGRRLATRARRLSPSGPQASALSTPRFRPALVPGPGPALKFGVVERDTGTTAGKDEHAGGDQLVTDMSGRAGVPGSGGDAGGFGEDMI